VIGFAYGRPNALMTLRQLAYLAAVVEHASFTRAAAELGVAQPSLSQQIKALELELDVKLLERLPRSIRLTAAGRAFLPEARLAVRSAARAARSARSVVELEAGDLEILAIMSVAVGMLPGLIRRWHRSHPSVAIRLHEYIHVNALEEDLRNGRGDVAIGPRLARWSGPVVPLGWEEFYVVLAPDDELRAESSVPISRLADREWVLFDRENSLSDVITFACGGAGGFAPRGAVRTSQVSAAANLAAAGLGATLIPATIIPPKLRATVRPLDPPIVRELAAHARNAWSPAAAAFVEMLKERQSARELPPNARVVATHGRTEAR
jgi:DNA-binding transcriptional LysR family regulator